MSDSKKITSQQLLSMGQWETKAEVLDVSKGQKKLFIGIPAETTYQENRVALVPSSILTLVAHGHRVMVESGAGLKANFSDNEYISGSSILYPRMTLPLLAKTTLS